MPRNLSLDIGDKRIGVALSDPGGILASPLTIIQRRDDMGAVTEIIGLLEQHDVGRVIVGLPRSMDGSLGMQADKVQAFVQKLAAHTQVPLEFQDERLSTVSARRLLKEASGKKRRRIKEDDAHAAAVILQEYLDEAHLAGL